MKYCGSISIFYFSVLEKASHNLTVLVLINPKVKRAFDCSGYKKFGISLSVYTGACELVCAF